MVWSSVFSKALHIHHHHHHHHHNPERYPPPTLESAVMEETVSAAEAVVLKWAVDGGTAALTLFDDSGSRDEATRFLSAVKDLQRAMHFFVGKRDRHGQEALERAHRMTKTAMAWLQKEFYQLLSANRQGLDSESLHRSSISTATSCSSLEEDLCSLGIDDAEESSCHYTQETPASSTTGSSSTDYSAQQQLITDLRSIAESMVAAGYAKECLKAYHVVRRSSVDEALFRLGFPRLSPAQLHRLGADTESRLKSWPHAARSAVRSLFSFERALCDSVFGFADDVRESAFTEVASEGAAHLLAFPETATKAVRRWSPEKTFELLDAYTALAELMPEVDRVFSHASTAGIMAQAVRSLGKLAEAVRSAVAEFEDAVHKYGSKVPVPGGAIHPLTRYAMNYLAFLADYGPALSQIFADHPLPPQKPLPENFFFQPTPPSSGATPPTSAPASPSRSEDCSFDDDEASDAADPHGNVAPRVAWLVLVILCRLDAEAGQYKDNVPLAYLFLANNLAYVASKVRSSSLRRLLGAEWVSKHQAKARQYARTYEKLAWKDVTGAIPRDPSKLEPLSAAEVMRWFNAVFEDACRRQAGWVVPEARMREELKKSIARKVMVPYTEFYEAWRRDPVVAGAVRSAPQDVWNHLSDLFCATSVSASRSASPSRSSGSGTSTPSRWRSGQ